MCATVRALAADRPRHQSEPETGTLQKHDLTLRTAEGEVSIVRDQARTVRPQARTVRPLKKQKNPKVTGSIKCIFSVLTDCPRCTVGLFATALSNI
jgi:hypothetical protein